ncbi:MAG: Gfo/Idh/MocA family oxidoreductase, partial [Phycisphaeraceae bacterium]|nr:Gfo/Idh/MocA family oxidoreductase [Phycisphaeraceae bacterium]
MKYSVAVSSGLALPSIVPSSVFGASAPSNKITVGCIGVGNQGTGNMTAFVGRGRGDSVVVAACDVDAGHLESARVKAGLDKSSCYNDFRELIARPDIDAVAVSTPDHWHTLISLAAIKSGKDVFCEKPLTLTIAEGRALSDAATRYGRVVQTGSQQRSSRLFRRACEFVRNGKIGKLKTVRVDIPGNNRANPMDWKLQPVPKGFDYNMWLGQAPNVPYHPMRCHYTFRFLLAHSGGQMTNWGAHYLDIAQWGIGADNSGPLAIHGKGEFPKGGLFTTAEKADIVYTYADDVKLILKQYKGNGGNIRFEGSEGWISVNRKRMEAEPDSLLTYNTKPQELHLYNSLDHK